MVYFPLERGHHDKGPERECQVDGRISDLAKHFEDLYLISLIFFHIKQSNRTEVKLTSAASLPIKRATTLSWERVV